MPHSVWYYGSARLISDNWVFDLHKSPCIIGRTPNNLQNMTGNPDLCLPPEKTISRRQASLQFNYQNCQWEIVCMGRNGLKVNNQLVLAGNPARQLYNQ